MKLLCKPVFLSPSILNRSDKFRLILANQNYELANLSKIECHVSATSAPHQYLLASPLTSELTSLLRVSLLQCDFIRTNRIYTIFNTETYTLRTGKGGKGVCYPKFTMYSKLYNQDFPDYYIRTLFNFYIL